MHPLSQKFAFLLFAVSAILFSACFPPEEPNENGGANLPKLTDFQREVRSLKTADFDYIFVFKRKDGDALTADDKQFIKEKAHYATNRFTLSEDGKAVFTGSNYKFEESSLEELKARFDFQDFSKPPEQIEKEKQSRKVGNSENNPDTGGADKGNSN